MANSPIYLPAHQGIGELFTQGLMGGLNKMLEEKVKNKRKETALTGIGFDDVMARKMSQMPDNLLNMFLSKQLAQGGQLADKRFKSANVAEGLLAKQFGAVNKEYTTGVPEDVNFGQQGTIGELRNLINSGVDPNQAVNQARADHESNIKTGGVLAKPSSTANIKDLKTVFKAVSRGAISKKNAISKLIKSGWSKEDAATLSTGKPTVEMVKELLKRLVEIKRKQRR